MQIKFCFSVILDESTKMNNAYDDDDDDDGRR